MYIFLCGTSAWVVRLAPELVLPDLLSGASWSLNRLAAGESLRVGSAESAPFFRLLEALETVRFIPGVRGVLGKETWISIEGTVNQQLKTIGYLLDTVVISGVGYYDHADPDSRQLWPVWALLRPKLVALEYAGYQQQHGMAQYLVFREEERAWHTRRGPAPSFFDGHVGFNLLSSTASLLRIPDPRYSRKLLEWLPEDSPSMPLTIRRLAMQTMLGCMVGVSVARSGRFVPPEHRRFPLPSANRTSRPLTNPPHRERPRR